MTVVLNDNNELIPSRTVTGWRVCIDFCKLNDATRKDHFPLPFIDQILERLSGNEYYCFLDGFSSFFQIPIAPEDQEKTTFTCPYRNFAYRRMSFGLCNAPATFQRCMTAIFHDMVEDFMEVFMDDLSVFVYTDHSALKYLFSKQDAKPRLIRWALLLQGFNIEIKDKKRAENLADDHLSRLENPNIGELVEEEIEDKFTNEHLMILKTKLNEKEPWYADYVNYIVRKVVPPEWTPEKKKTFLLPIAVDYVSKWVEAHALPTNDARVVVKFLKGLFPRFGVPKALISDREEPNCNSQLEKALFR
ncbi:reverse transcriptase domain-containing protein [Tanacetum coccineum]|uniref:Reverse transcriptase domain-containing protein n=1 Tax=Tanacetum coccineum TaxID=301880 RepID=A0ABQ4Y351_9ASTR